MNNQLRVLVHEYIHFTEDLPWSTIEKDFQTTLPEPPAHIKTYIMNVLSEGDEFSYQQYMYITRLRDPQYYKNEVNAYMKEKELFWNLPESERAELEYRIWYYSELAKLAEMHY